MAINLFQTSLPMQAAPDEGAGYDMRRKIAEMLMAQQMKESGKPIQHWTQGAAQMVDSLTSAMLWRKAMQDEAAQRKAGIADTESLLGRMFGGGGGAGGAAGGGAPVSSPAPVAPVDFKPNMGEMGPSPPPQPISDDGQEMLGPRSDALGPDRAALAEALGQPPPKPSIITGMSQVQGPELPIARDNAPPGGGPITATPDGQINPVAFSAAMREKVAASRLNGQAPPWAQQFGVRTGSPEEWARFFTMLQQQESGHRTAPVNPDGSLRKFATTPAGERSYGPGQFNVGEYGLKTWADVNNPDKVGDAYIRVAEAGKIPAYFGSVQRPNEVAQHGKWYDRTVGNQPAPSAAPAPSLMALAAPDGVAQRSVKTQAMGPAPAPQTDPRPLLAQAGGRTPSAEEIGIIARMANSRDPGQRAIGARMLEAYQKRFAPTDMERAQLEHSRNAETRAQEMHPAELDLKRAQASQARQKDELNSAIGGLIKGAITPKGMPAPAPRVQPQSFNGTGEAQLIPAQAAAPQGPAQSAPRMVDTPLGKMTEEKARLLGFGIAMTGKGEAGRMFSDAANAGQLGKEGQNDLDKKMIAAADNFSNLKMIQARFRPDYQQIEQRIGYKWSALQDKAGGWLGQINPGDRKALEEFSAYRSDAIDAFNNYIKSVTGAAMTESEAKRIQAAFPKAGEGIFDGDSPSEFKSKLDAAILKTQLALARYTYAKNNGKDWQFIGLEADMPKIIQQRTDLLQRQFMQQGAPQDQVPGLVQRALKQEFGI